MRKKAFQEKKKKSDSEVETPHAKDAGGMVERGWRSTEAETPVLESSTRISARRHAARTEREKNREKIKLGKGLVQELLPKIPSGNA